MEQQPVKKAVRELLFGHAEHRGEALTREDIRRQLGWPIHKAQQELPKTQTKS